MVNRATSAKVARSADLLRLREELGNWAGGPGPVVRQLERALAAAVDRGALAPGSRLPAERQLARAVAVSRGTAVAAYEALVADGVVERRRGSGTYVIGPGVLALPPGREGTALVHRLVERSARPGQVIDLWLSVLASSDGLPPVTISTADLAEAAPGPGYSPWGLPGLRHALSDLMGRWGLDAPADQIVVTTGAQQAISLAAACWLRPGDRVVVEDPSYPGAIATFQQAGARLVGVPVDRDGVRIGPLTDALAERPALVYLQSTLHSPTGAILAGARRRRVAELVRQYHVPLVEDLALAGLAWRPAPPPIASHCADGPVAVVGSLSKVLWGGLRVGWAWAPGPLALRLARVKATHDLGSSVVSQLMAERLLRAAGPSFQEDRNADLRRRYDVLAGALSGLLPRWTWTEPAGGLSIWARLPAPLSAELAEAAGRRGVGVASAGPLSASTGAPADRLRLSFSLPPEALEEGVERLADAWHEVSGPRATWSTGRPRKSPRGA